MKTSDLLSCGKGTGAHSSSALRAFYFLISAQRHCEAQAEAIQNPDAGLLRRLAGLLAMTVGIIPHLRGEKIKKVKSKQKDFE